MRREIEGHLAALVGKPLWKSGRAADLQWFQFGEQREVAGLSGRLKEVGEWALHLQCAWRITGPSGILVASRDRYYPAGSLDEIPDDFEWDVQGANRCDERIAALFTSTPTMLVEAAGGDDVGGFQLSFPSDVRLEVFPDVSLPNEYWRLFRPSDSLPHFVVTGHGAEPK